jgi:hypothetical protein
VGRRRSVTFAALVASFGMCVPVPLVRGAWFSLFPGIVQRSRRVMLKGALRGVGFEVVWYVGWGFCAALLGIGWDPRYGYNRFLASWLPGAPLNVVKTHWPSSLSIAEQYPLHMMIWLTLMMTNWWLLLRPRPHVARFGLALLTVNALTWPACHAMWAIAPRDDYWGSADPRPTPCPTFGGPCLRSSCSRSSAPSRRSGFEEGRLVEWAHKQGGKSAQSRFPERRDEPQPTIRRKESRRVTRRASGLVWIPRLRGE